MKIVNTDIRGWRPTQSGYITPEGYELTSKQVERQCKFLSVPTTLLSIDNRFGLDTTLQVLRAASTGTERLLVSDDDLVVYSVMDHRSRFMGDDEFHSMLDTLKKKGFEDLRVSERDGSIRATFTFDSNESDSVLGDLFKRRIVLERLPQGGVYSTASLLRLACTNGMLVADSQYREHFRKEVNEKKMLDNFDRALNLNTLEYFEKMFSKDGKWIEASVADFMGMRQTLEAATTPEIAGEFFPIKPIQEHYEAQNIEVFKMARPVQAKLPAGVTYYDAFNILTNGIKRAEKLDLSDEIEVGKWARPSYLKQLRESDIAFHGKPNYPESMIDRLRGDIA